MVMEEQESELASERIPVPQVKELTIDAIKRNKSSASSGKPRLRKKALHASIVKQMEFYFSDANLNKDRFLSGLLKENPYVDLDVFVTFNKIRELTTDVNRIAKALQRSTMLKVSEDGTKVCRLTPVIKKENTDECTIYIQNLPPDADHDWLTSFFSNYGPVVYVSIPRYKNNKKIKGFAFIEFDTPNGVKECIKVFQKLGRVLPSHTTPNDLLSISTFDDSKKGHIITNTNAKIVKSKKNSSNDETEDSNNIHDANENADEIDVEGSRPKKRKISKESLIKDNDIKVKKMKIFENENVNHEDNEKRNIENEETNKNNDDKIAGKKKKRFVTNDTDVEETIKKKRKDLNKSNNDSEMEILLETEEYPMAMNTNAEEREVSEERETEDKKKKRKRNRNKIYQQDVICNMGLQVMAKPDWKRLRNRYLELQKNKMTLLKQHLKKAEVGRNEITTKNKSNYDKSKHEKDNEKIDDMKKSIYGCVDYVPGIIVKIEMDEPCTDPRNFKMELKDINYVKYIDIIDGSCEAYVRCDTAETAQLFAQKSYDGRRLTILKDDEEKSYWNKIAKDRQEKLNAKHRNKQRGRNKLLKKAEKQLGKCIKFDQD